VLDALAGFALVALAFVLELDGLANIYMMVKGAGVLVVVASVLSCVALSAASFVSSTAHTSELLRRPSHQSDSVR